MKPNNGSKDMWLRAETANWKLKQYAQTEDADGMQAMVALNMTQLEANFQ